MGHAAIYPREIAKRCLEVSASAVIMAHNHPSGSVEPSENDYLITKDVLFALKLIDIDCLDHMIIGADDYFSMADSGHIAHCKMQYQIFKKEVSNED